MMRDNLCVIVVFETKSILIRDVENETVSDLMKMAAIKFKKRENLKEEQTVTVDVLYHESGAILDEGDLVRDICENEQNLYAEFTINKTKYRARLSQDPETYKQPMDGPSTPNSWNILRRQEFPKDGLPTDDLTILRDEKIQQIKELTDKNTSTLIISPPFTGKTCLAQLFAYKYVFNCQEPSFVCGISFASVPIIENMQQFYDFFNKNIVYRENFVYKKLLDEADNKLEACLNIPDILILADDTQQIYHVTEFWTQFKEKLCKPCCKLLAFATYGSDGYFRSSSTPLNLDCYDFYNFVKFSEAEFYELAGKFRMKFDPEKKIMTDRVLEDLAIMTNYSPGLTFICMRAILYEFPREMADQTDKVYNEAAVNSLISTGKLANYVFNTLQARALKTIERIIEIAYNESVENSDIETNIMNLFYQLVYYGEAGVDAYSFEQSILIKLGVCIKISETRISFSSPLAQIFYLKNYIHVTMSKVPTPTQYKFPSRIKTFLIDVMRRFDPRVLESSLARRNHGRANEIAYNQEFHRVAHLLYFKTIGGSLSYNVGSCYQMKGAIDLYLSNQTQFGFEFLIRSSRIEENIQRFTERYVDIPMKQFALIDFYDCSDEKDATQQASAESEFYSNPNYYRVFFFDSFKKFVLKHQQEINSYDVLDQYY